MLFGSAFLRFWDSKNFEIILLEAYQRGCCRIFEHGFSMLKRVLAINNFMLLCFTVAFAWSQSDLTIKTVDSI